MSGADLGGPLPVASPPETATLPAGFRLRLDPRVRRWGQGSVLIGGSPWRVSRMAPAAQEFLSRLIAAGAQGASAESALDLRIARLLLDRGFAHPLPRGGDATTPQCTVAVPALNRLSNLARLLGSVTTRPLVVVDDGSDDPDDLERTASALGAMVLHHPRNRGPAAARNTALRATTTDIVAFVDSDCRVTKDWPTALLFHFDDPAVAAVAPRVCPEASNNGPLERYEATRSSLDMGRMPELVLPGARLGFIPSAAIIVRRSALGESGFDEALRVGEDVDLIWRLTEAGWQVRFDPSIQVMHEMRSRPRDWIVRRFQYGTSAARLESRHPGNLAPARVSAWNLAVIALVAARRPAVATVTAAVATGLLARHLADVPAAPALAARTVGQGLVADAAAIGHLLRREWWPVGLAALALAPRSRTARVATACMLAPIAWEWAFQRPDLDPVRYTALRLLDDAAYGSGVISSSVRARTWAPLMPRVRLTRFGRSRRSPR